MKSTEITVLSGVMFTAFSIYAQGTFQNLDFESATPSTPITGPITGATYQPVGLALPGWTAYIGSDQQSEVLQNTYGHGAAEIDLFGPNYPAAGWPPNDFDPGVIDGNYSVLLQAGADPQTGALVGVSIAQTGMVPTSSQSLEFKAWQTLYTQFSVSLGGDTLSTVVLATGPNYTLYGASIPPSLDGQSAQLEFTADFVTPGTSWLGLDDIAFSMQAVPEPSPLALTGVGALLFALHRRFPPKRP